MIRAHVKAVVDLIDAVPNVTVYDAVVPNMPTLPYAVVYGDSGSATQSNFRGQSGWRQWAMRVTSVGSTPEQARWCAERVETALLDIRPTVTGRKCSTVDKTLALPVQRDDDVDPAVFYIPDEFQYLSTPA